MADVKEFVYRDKHVTVTVNQDAGKYLGVVDIEGMTLSQADKTGPSLGTPDAAFESARRKAQELIDAQAGR